MNGLNIKFDTDELVFGYDFKSVDKHSYFQNGDHSILIPSFNKKNEVLNYMVGHLDLGEPLICFINSNILTHHQVYRKNKGQIHAIIIDNINIFTNKCRIIDSHIRISSEIIEEFIGEYNLNDILPFIICMWSFKKRAYYLSNEEYYKKILLGMQRYITGDSRNSVHYGNSAIHEYLNTKKESLHLLKEEELINFCIQLYYDIQINGFGFLLKYTILLQKELGIDISKGTAIENSLKKISENLLRAGHKKDYKKLVTVITSLTDLNFKLNIYFNEIITEIKNIQ
ncbi:hypothetical protein [Paenibacillus solani]|uniref:hypothetical protein n=1 Tax=Paenibacillus solani TaxID=1705565 RepID=UPI003D29241A